MNDHIKNLLNYIPRVDLTVECVLDETMCSAQVDDPNNPKSLCIQMQVFWYFAGDPCTEWARKKIAQIPTYDFIMPSAAGWLEEIGKLYAERLQPYTRFSFSAESLSRDHLAALWDASPHKGMIRELDAESIEKLTSSEDNAFGIEAFASVEDFLNRGFGFVAKRNEQVVGHAYSTLLSRKGMEVSIWVAERQRQRGMATALASRLLLESLDRGLEPHWDAANSESVKLAKKLGYNFSGTYDAYYLVQ
jgi:RimJ/RimL family protein N-acetyltransferase